MTLIQLLNLFLGLSILIILHELGHFIPAKLFGTRVRKFYLFFDFLFPFSKVLNFSLFKIKIGDTEYGLGWFPFGGYVDIAGMVDETTSADDLDKDDTPKEKQFRFKPAWQRLIIMVGGVTVNLVLAMIIYAGLFGAYGDEYLPNKNVKNGIMVVDSVGYDLGLQDGDKLVSLDGKPVEKFDDFQKDLLLDQAKKLVIDRDGKLITLPVSREFLGSLIQKKKTQIVIPIIPFTIDSILAGKPAAAAGFQRGDKILSVNGTTTDKYSKVQEIIKSNPGKELGVTVERSGKIDSLKVTVGKDGFIGVTSMGFEKYYSTEKIQYGFFGSISKGVQQPFVKIGEYWKSLKLMGLPKVKVKDNMGGFYSMGKIYPKTFDWRSFWTITAFISVILALMNILPIPMLDGGYILFLFYEMIVGKPLPEKVQNVLQSIGLFLILGLMLFANGMDVIRGIFS